MAGSAAQEEEEISGINVTPLVDIVLVLLIIFMVTANFIVRETIEVDLPRAANGGETVQGLVNLVVDKEGKLFFDGAEVTEDDLLLRVTEAIAKDPETRAVISADQSGIPASKQILVPTLAIKKGEVEEFIVKINKLRGRS